LTARGSWKRNEREIAERLGGVRVPVTGRSRGDAPDIAHDRYGIECKMWSALPKRVTDAMDQAKASCRGEQIPLVVLHAKGARHDEDLVVLRLADFAALVEDAG